MPLYHIHGLSVNVLATAMSGASVICSPGYRGPDKPAAPGTGRRVTTGDGLGRRRRGRLTFDATSDVLSGPGVLFSGKLQGPTPHDPSHFGGHDQMSKCSCFDTCAMLLGLNRVLRPYVRSSGIGLHTEGLGLLGKGKSIPLGGHVLSSLFLTPVPRSKYSGRFGAW